MVFAYHSTLAPLAECRSLHFRFAVAENCAFALLSLITSALVGGPVECFHVFEGATDLAELASLLTILAGMQVSMDIVRLSSALQRSQFDVKKAYLRYHHSR